jgi:hypothetical protein
MVLVAEVPVIVIIMAELYSDNSGCSNGEGGKNSAGGDGRGGGIVTMIR